MTSHNNLLFGENEKEFEEEFMRQKFPGCEGWIYCYTLCYTKTIVFKKSKKLSYTVKKIQSK